MVKFHKCPEILMKIKKKEYSNTERVQLFILCDVRLKQESDITLIASLQQKKV